jgi:hypothetical protein
MAKAYSRYSKIGFMIGSIFSIVVFLICWCLVMEDHFDSKTFYYEGFLFREKCKKEGKSDLQAATERFRLIHGQPDFDPKDHPDVKNGYPEAFIRGILGYNLWDGFGYGEKPGRLETFFELQTIYETCCIVWMLGFPLIIILLSPFIGGFVGFIWYKRHG